MEENNEIKLPRPYKQCPDCLEKLPLDAKKCSQCGQRVGKIMSDGKARKPIDWLAYAISAALIGAFIYYMRWAFFSD
jgi:predicted nucleic acid-binding Zn ribbon protein